MAKNSRNGAGNGKVKFIPYTKLSKKKRKERDGEKRNTWDGISPVTRVAPDKKKYDRRREKRNAFDSEE